MKILLVNPPIPNCFKIFDLIDEDARKTFSQRVIIGPPLGLNYIGAMLPEDDIVIYDMKAESENDKNFNIESGFINQLKEFKPDVVGFTCITPQFNTLKKLLKLSKKFNKNLLTIVGGLHASSAPEDFKDCETDLLVLGVGQTTFYNIIEELKKNRGNASFQAIPGVAIKEGNRFYYTQSLNKCNYKEFREIHFREEIFPNRKLTEKYEYINPIVGKRLTYFITSLGCTHKCNFCYLWKFTNGRYYFREVENIIAELKTLDRYPLIRLCDAHTFGNIRKAEELFAKIIDEGLDSHIYVGDVRTDTAVRYPELMELAGKAGLKAVVCGLEAASDEELARYGKENTIEKSKKAFKLLSDAGINVLGNYMVHPDFDEYDFEVLGDFIANNPIARSNLTILTPFPGTGQWEELKDQIIIRDYDYYNLATAVVKTKLPEKIFYDKISELLKISGNATDTYYRKYNKNLVI